MLKHKFVSGISLLLIIIGGYFSYLSLTGNKNIVRYATAAVEKSTLIVSVSGSGQVLASNQVDIKPKVSGDIVYVGIKDGQEIAVGTLLVQVDSHNAQKVVRDAETTLETVQLELSKLLAPPDELDLLKAENALITAKRDLEELVNPSESTLTQAENLLTATKDNLTKLKFNQESNYQNTLESRQKAEDSLLETYEDIFNTIANAFLDLPTVITGIRDVLYSSEIAKSEITLNDYQWNIGVFENCFFDEDKYKLEPFINSAENNYKTARENYDKNFENYKSASRYSKKEIIETLLNETTETTKSIAETVKSENNLLDFIVDYFSDNDRRVYSQITEYQSDIKSYTSKTNSLLSGLLSAQRSLEDKKEAILNAERSIKEINQNQPLDLASAKRNVREKEEALFKLKNPEQYKIEAARIAVKEKELGLENLKAGADELDIRAKKIAVQQKEDALQSAQQSLADYYIRAPFDGLVAKVNVKKGESVSSNAVVTLITKQEIAEISLNEVDVAKVKTGQKATLTFDAVENLTITGEVIEVDTIGTASQGVVSYSVKIAFDTQDERIKPGMSVTADIIIEAKQDVLVLSSSAIKSQGDSYYVELVEAPEQMSQELSANVSGIVLSEPPKLQLVEIGLSNDLSTEIVSGLKEGDIVVTSIISSNSTPTIQSRGTQGFQIPGMGGQIMREFR